MQLNAGQNSDERWRRWEFTGRGGVREFGELGRGGEKIEGGTEELYIALEGRIVGGERRQWSAKRDGDVGAVELDPVPNVTG
ncbi:hypothetical protein E2562_007913 [Oryza meyeriana var. granulata]|uniref:DUF834 domain-containing protein n=1 Tax=Oryza meyeriana var. granulata TaxID=110450 RepID=A0A6G1DVW3_9ORYZ|nr:hypothetical protein E2562_007913 [Oryza meyeriana var. granulata]